jgi:diguanylate cyclase (GGDEF)-like protein/PAS domain S-box-containing protein
MFGYCADEILETPISRLCSPLNRERVPTTRVPRREKDPMPGEQWYFRKDGSSFFATSRLIALEQVNGINRGAVMIVHDITPRKYEEEALRRKAFYDELTGLPNRALFLERCARARNRAMDGYGFAVVFVDLDNFKALNDKYGHAIGDQLLTKVANELELSLRPDDFVARLSGDEFAILLEGISGPETATHVAERARRAITREYIIAGANVSVTASVGIARGARDDSPEQVLRAADFAMYEAKRRGRNQHAAFDSAMAAPSPSLRRLNRELREGIERKELFLEYQPIVELATLRVVGFEGLVRWKHPQRGTLAAGEFVPLAENSGLIIQIDRWVFATAAAQLSAWQRNAKNNALTVSVNFSTMGLARPDTLTVIRDAVQRSRVKPRTMKIEITETVLMETSEHVVATLTGLRELGMEFYLDDFGTGYSTLDYLRRCGATTLKIDRSFVSGATNNEGNVELVRAIISLAHTLRLRTIAEGVETEDELAMLQDANCDYAQGFLFRPPLGVDSATNLLETQNFELPSRRRLTAASQGAS